MTIPLPFQVFFETLGARIASMEARRGTWFVIAVVSLCLLCAAFLYVRPSFPFFPSNLSGGSTIYAELARDPLVPGVRYIHRILTPLIAYLLGLRGDGIIIVNLVFATALIGGFYFYYARLTPSRVLPLAAAALITFSMPTLYTVFDLWTVDSATYFFVFLMVLCRKNCHLF